jgi:hypothetical protein
MTSAPSVRLGRRNPRHVLSDNPSLIDTRFSMSWASICSLVIAVLLASLAVDGQAPSLPAPVRANLDRSHPGWSLVRSADASAPANVVEGDFDGNGMRDYALLIAHRPSNAASGTPAVGHVVACLQGPHGYRMVPVTSPIEGDRHLDRLEIAAVRKGTRVHDLNDDTNVTLEHDGIRLNPAGSGPCTTFVFRRRAFASLWTCD